MPGDSSGTPYSEPQVKNNRGRPPGSGKKLLGCFGYVKFDFVLLFFEFSILQFGYDLNFWCYFIAFFSNCQKIWVSTYTEIDEGFNA